MTPPTGGAVEAVTFGMVESIANAAEDHVARCWLSHSVVRVVLESALRDPAFRAAVVREVVASKADAVAKGEDRWLTFYNIGGRPVHIMERDLLGFLLPDAGREREGDDGK